MNAQRQRRFKTIYNRLQKNENLKEGAWDSNSITPGTQFLAELTNELKFFIQHKLNSDPEWKDIKIVLSGPEVPGEGEHKIAEFIRHQKGLADYDPTTTFELSTNLLNMLGTACMDWTLI
jgi:5'-3' exoribonuclease 1